MTPQTAASWLDVIVSWNGFWFLVLCWLTWEFFTGGIATVIKAVKAKKKEEPKKVDNTEVNETLKQAGDGPWLKRS